MSETWWLCPLGTCEHGAVLHDGDGSDEPFTCCAEGCDCKGSTTTTTTRTGPTRP